jgi:hypothetical protein
VSGIRLETENEKYHKSTGVMALSVFSVQTVLLEKIKSRYKALIIGELYYRSNLGSSKSMTKKREDDCAL